MCSMNDDPTTYDAPEPTRPRTYRLSGDRPESRKEPVSVALAVLGDLLSEAEAHADARQSMYGSAPWPDVPTIVRLETLREARDRVAAAEAAQ